MTTKELCEELCILGNKMSIPQDTNHLQIKKQEIIKELEASIRKEVVDYLQLENGDGRLDSICKKILDLSTK